MLASIMSALKKGARAGLWQDTLVLSHVVDCVAERRVTSEYEETDMMHCVDGCGRRGNHRECSAAHSDHALQADTCPFRARLLRWAYVKDVLTEPLVTRR
jgi:hypothetical protein